MLVFIIIPTHNRQNLLFNCLLSIKKQTYQNYKVVIVNDGSIDGTQKMISENFPDYDVLLGNGDLWWTGAINLGIKFVLNKLSKNDYVLLLNDDIEIDDNYLKNIVDVAKHNDRSLIGSVSVDISNPDTITYGGNIINSWTAKTNYVNRNKRLSDINQLTIVECSNLIGRGTLIPSSVFYEVGMFNAKRFKHRGDTELSVRAKKAGYKLIVTYKAVVKMYPKETFSIDNKEHYEIKDFYKKFFDFRSSSFIKYQLYYSWIQSKNLIQFISYFLLTNIANLRQFFIRLIWTRN